MDFLALMLLGFIANRMVRSAHLTLSPILFTAQFDFTISDRYSYGEMGGSQHYSPKQARPFDLEDELGRFKIIPEMIFVSHN